MNDHFKAHLCLWGATIIAGFNYSISKIVMPEFIKPFGIITIRLFVSTIFFGAIYFLFAKEKIQRTDFPKLIICAILGMAANQLLFYKGLSLTTPINAALMMASSPIFVLIISVFLNKEKLTSLKIFGITTSATGAILLIINSSASATKGISIGDILIVLNSFCWASFIVLVKPLTKKYHILTLIFYLFLFGGLFGMPVGLNEYQEISWETMPKEALYSLAFIIVFATFTAYYLNIRVLKTVNPSVAGSYIYLQPVMATIVALSFGKDILTIEKICFSLLILSGIYMVSKKTKERLLA